MDEELASGAQPSRDPTHASLDLITGEEVEHVRCVDRAERGVTEPDVAREARKPETQPVERGLADGFRVDRDGNVWTSDGDAVTVYAPDGTPLLQVVVGEVVANVCFGGAEGTDLFVAASSSLYRLRTNAVGADLKWL